MGRRESGLVDRFEKSTSDSNGIKLFDFDAFIWNIIVYKQIEY